MIIKKIRQPYFKFTKEQNLFMDNIYKKCKSPNYNELLLNIPISDNSKIMTKKHIKRYFKNKRYRQKKKK